MNIQEEYNDHIHQYLGVLADIRKAERKGEERSMILFLDNEKNRIHNTLKKLAPQLGKKTKDVDIEILCFERNLREYGLEEFHMLDVSQLFHKAREKPLVARLNNDVMVYESVGSHGFTSDELETYKYLIPFGEEIGWHLFDYDQFFNRLPEDLEEKRRARTVADEKDLGAYYVEMEIPKTFHQRRKIFGLLVSSDTYEKALHYIYKNRERVSIKEAYFDPVQIEKDVQHIVREDVDNIVKYASFEEKEGGSETVDSVLERYADERKSHFSPDQMNIVFQILSERKNELAQEKKEQYERELEEQFGNDEPKHQGMGKRR